MADGIDAAAKAFESDMGGNDGADNGAVETGSTENIFPNMGELEADSGVAGGDDLPIKVRQPVAKKTVEEDDTDEWDEDALLYGDDEPDPKAKQTADGDEEDEDGADDEEGGEKQPLELTFEDDELDANITITVDGEEKKVPLREAINGYIRTDTFHTRLNQLDEVKQALRQEASSLVEVRKKYSSMISELQGHLDALVPKEPDWDALFREDPTKARALQKQYDDYHKTIEALKRNKAEADNEANEASNREAQQWEAQEQAKILKANPHWSDAKKRDKDLNSVIKTLRTAGFGNDEIASVKDSRMMEVVLKASKYDRMMANRPKPTKRGKRPLNPGAGNSRTAPKGNMRAQRQLSRTGSVDAAASVFADILKME